MAFLNDLFNIKPVKLTESRHGDLFSDMKRIAGGLPPEVEAKVGAVKKLLRTADAVHWFLRLWKVGYVEQFEHEQVGNPKLPDHYASRVISDYARRAGISEADARAQGWQVFNDADLLRTLNHFLALPSSTIRSYQFGYHAPDDVLAHFGRAEQSLQEEATDAFEDPEAVKVIGFPNGLAWFDTGRESCTSEGRAMGHGGNTGTPRAGDRLLSLRQTFDHDDGSSLHKPLLTFVLDKNGMLGEMKGPFNGKPERKYHNEIVALLKSDLVHGIKGGGFRPENNFAMRDLDEETRAELLEEKPELGGLYELYKSYGIEDERVMDVLRQRMADEHVMTEALSLSHNGRTFAIQRWSDVTHFLHEIGDGIVAGAVDLYDGKAVEQKTITHLDPTDVAAILAHLDDETFVFLMRALSLRALPSTHPSFERLRMVAAERLIASPFNDTLVAAANASTRLTGEVRDRVREHIAAYFDAGYRFKVPFARVHLDVDALDKPVMLVIPVEDLVSIVSARDGDFDDYLAFLDDAKHDGWGSLDLDEVRDAREALGLSTQIDRKAGLTSDPFFADLEHGRDLFDVERAANLFAREIGY